MGKSYVQFGCGTSAPEGWDNFDAGPVFWLQKYLFFKPVFRRKGYPIYPVKAIKFADVVAGLPVRPRSADGVYCSHVLEHLTLDEFRAAIRNVFTYLQPGGIFRMVVPDLEFLVRRYNETSGPEAAG